MSGTRGYSVNARGDVVLTMSREDHEELVYALGRAWSGGAAQLPIESLALLNRLEEGNPAFIPYELPTR